MHKLQCVEKGKMSKAKENKDRCHCNCHIFVSQFVPFSGDLPAIDDLGGSGHRAEVAHASSTSSPKGGGRERGETSTSQTAHGCHVTHMTHGAHGTKRTKA